MFRGREVRAGVDTAPQSEQSSLLDKSPKRDSRSAADLEISRANEPRSYARDWRSRCRRPSGRSTFRRHMPATTDVLLHVTYLVASADSPRRMARPFILLLEAERTLPAGA
jgi:hypothetical protein